VPRLAALLRRAVVPALPGDVHSQSGRPRLSAWPVCVHQQRERETPPNYARPGPLTTTTTTTAEKGRRISHDTRRPSDRLSANNAVPPSINPLSTGHKSTHYVLRRSSPLLGLLSMYGDCGPENFFFVAY